jgi:hypothetical protein
LASNRNLVWAVIGVLGLAAIVAWLIIWPNYREAAHVKQRIVELERKIAGHGEQTIAITSLSNEVSNARRRMETELKIVPSSPDVADLIRKLSLPVDGANVIDQTFTAGSPVDVNAGEAGSAKAMPLMVELAATFDSVFALLRSAESMNRLLRVASVKVVCKRNDDKFTDIPVLQASLGLEAIYEPVVSEERR